MTDITDVKPGDVVVFEEPEHGRMVGEVHETYPETDTLDVGVGVTVYGVPIDSVLLAVDPDTAESIREWFSKPVDFGFPDGYCPGEF